ncbi:MAG: hypothetical protein H8E66_09140 [Planctomycetes bacterium]|nr:hypothetical protein [Planctomycetota bacterium]
MKSATSLSVILILLSIPLPLLAQTSSDPDAAQLAFDAPSGITTLEFRRAQNEPAEGYVETTIVDSDEKIYLRTTSDLSNEGVVSAQVVPDSTGQPAIEVEFTATGARKLAALTTEHTGKRLAVVVNGEVISAPTIKGVISRKAVISGHFSLEEAKELASGILPPPFQAQLMCIKPDWSKVALANEIEAEMREALKDASVSKKLLDRLPASGAEILFPKNLISFYTHQHYAELLAWLEAKGLVVSTEDFPAAWRVPFAVARNYKRQKLPASQISSNRPARPSLCGTASKIRSLTAVSRTC